MLGAAWTPGATISLCRKVHPDVLVVDSSGDPNGRLVKDLVSRGFASTVVALVGPKEQHSLFVSTMRIFGTHGIIAQDAELPKLATALRSAHYLRSYIDPELLSLAGATLLLNHDTTCLSPRELEVLRLVASGCRNREIACQLRLSVETVRSHMKGCLRKLAARDRVQAVHLAYALGFLTPPVALGRHNTQHAEATTAR